MKTKSNARSETADGVSVILFAGATLLMVLMATTIRAFSTFREDGIAWTIPIDQQPISATTGSGTGAVEGYADEALVIATGVDALSVAAAVSALAVWALAAILIIICMTLIAWNFLRGRLFFPGNVRAFLTIGWTIIFAPITILLMEATARNGVTRALSLGPGEPLHPTELLAITPFISVGFAVTLIAVAFRRGMRLQHVNTVLEKETEGLV